MQPEKIYELLSEPFDYPDIFWRVGATNRDKTKAIALAYIDSRMVMNRLDQVVGWQNWQCRYPLMGVCEISIMVEGMWITKSNVAGESQVEAVKGQASDAFKRSAVLFGVGRYLYELPTMWADIEPCGNSYRIKTPPALPQWALSNRS